MSSDSESETEKTLSQATQKKVKKYPDGANPDTLTRSQNASNPGEMTDADVSAAFTKYYMQRATQEFAEDLDQLRGADDFRDDALPLLVNALQQGASLFSIEEQRRIVTAGLAKDQKSVTG